MKNGNAGFDIQRVREAPWGAILVFIILDMSLIALVNLVVFPSGIFLFFPRATLGLVNQTLVVNLLLIATLVYVLMIGFGRLSWSDLGIRKDRLLSGAGGTLAIWTLVQAITLIIGFISHGDVRLNAVWLKYSIFLVLGDLLSQLFGNSLFEEIAFRGFLMPQIGKKLGWRRKRMVGSVLISQTVFGLMHIPNRIYGGIAPSMMFVSIAVPVALGILFSVLYLTTDNLFLTIGIHALLNSPATLFEGFDSYPLLIVITIALIIIWPFTFGKAKKKEGAMANGEDAAHA